MIVFGDVHRKFHARCPALPLNQLILDDEVPVHQFIGVLPDIILIEFQLAVGAERTGGIPSLQHRIAFFADIIINDVEILFNRAVDKQQLIGVRVADIDHVVQLFQQL